LSVAVDGIISARTRIVQREVPRQPDFLMSME
jgi:hypothetical protein